MAAEFFSKLPKYNAGNFASGSDFYPVLLVDSSAILPMVIFELTSGSATSYSWSLN
ncbi:MAG: hypothetical protein IPO26_18320 [Saprospiraceae bacterium]|nr:hypothetical protein [Saprospiraceae bacterium]